MNLEEIVDSAVNAKILTFATNKGYDFISKEYFEYWKEQFVLVEETGNVLKFVVTEDEKRIVLGEMKLSSILKELKELTHTDTMLDKWRYLYGEERANKMYESVQLINKQNHFSNERDN